MLDIDSDGDEIGDGRDSFHMIHHSNQIEIMMDMGTIHGDLTEMAVQTTIHNGDWDGDGFVITHQGNNPDMCPNDWTQWRDEDGDGHGHAWGNNPDEFPYDSTQWRDSDGDGFGDNPSGNNA